MSEKINIDGVRFKVDANLDKLAEDLKKGEGVAKKGGEAMGKAAGKGFDQSLKSDVNKTLDDVKKTAESSSSALTGIFGKVGAAVAGAFALDKVVGFFKDSMKYASDMEEQMGSVSKATKDVREDFEALGKDSLWNKIKLSVGNLLNSLVDGAKAIAVGLSDLFKSPERIGQLYQRERDSIRSLGEEMNKLSAINKRTAEEELKLIDLKDKLSEKARKLGLDYDKLAASGMNYVQILKEMENKAKLNAQADLTTPMLRAIDRANQAQAGVTAIDQQISQLRADPGRARVLGLAPAEYLNQLERSRLRAQRDFDKARAEARRLSEQQDKLGAETPQETPRMMSGGRAIEQQRFIDSRLRIETINRNRRDTDSVINSDRSITEEERRRRLQMSAMEARQAIDYEVNSLRAGYAQFIEETHSAKMLAIKSEADNARRLSYELLEAELKQSGENEKEIEEAKKESAARLGEIAEAEARKQAALTAESFAKTMQAANSITSGYMAAISGTGGASISGVGGVLSGVSQLSDKLKPFGALGQGVSAVGGIVTTIANLFDKSESERQSEALRAEMQRREQIRLMELQANYQKNMLALQEAQAKLPFENLQRRLRLVDIEAGKQKLSGVSAEDADLFANQKKLSEIQSTLTSEGGKIAQGNLFGAVQSTPDSLISFLSERAGQSLAIAQFVQLLGQLSGMDDYSNVNIGFVEAVYSQLQSYQGLIPEELYNTGINGVARFLNAWRRKQQLGPGAVTQAQRDAWNAADAEFRSSALSGVIGSVNSLQSEITSDTSIAENLLSLIEQSNQLQLEISDNTKKTAANTSRLVDTPNRSSSLIDISRGLTRSLGQVISGPDLTNTALPNGVRAAVLATDIQKSIQERAADGIDRLNDTARKQLELLAIMVTILKNPSNVSPLTVAQLEDLYRRSGIRIAA